MRAAALATALVVVLLVQVTTATKPWFCHELDCPKFTVLRNSSLFEVREYPAAMWARTQLEGASDDAYDKAQREGFMRLFRYIEGANQNKTKVPMAAPVMTQVLPGAGPACNSTFLVHFFVPFAFQKDPALPSPGSGIELVQTPAVKVAVASYGGYSNWTSVQSVALQLGQHLDAAGFKHGALSTAGYDPPFRLFNRHNEVWLQVE